MARSSGQMLRRASEEWSRESSARVLHMNCKQASGASIHFYEAPLPEQSIRTLSKLRGGVCMVLSQKRAIATMQKKHRTLGMLTFM